MPKRTAILTDGSEVEFRDLKKGQRFTIKAHPDDNRIDTSTVYTAASDGYYDDTVSSECVIVEDL